MLSPIFFGIDLAWSSRNPTGAAVIVDGALTAVTGGLSDDEAIFAFVADHLPAGAPAVVAIDAPLCVPNRTGARLCDRLLSAEWRRFQAGALPANRRLLANADGVVRGERMVAGLAALGFVEAAPVPHQTTDRVVCEVYPHPAHVSLFDLARTLKYKQRSGRDGRSRGQEFVAYQRHLAKLADADPPLHTGVAGLLAVDVTTLHGRALKCYEDQLDAVTCAYVAAYLWQHGPQWARMYGDLRSGHILVPMTPRMCDRLGPG